MGRRRYHLTPEPACAGATAQASPPRFLIPNGEQEIQSFDHLEYGGFGAWANATSERSGTV